MGIASKGRRIVLGNLDEDARFQHRRSVLAHGRCELCAGRPRPWARVTRVETVVALGRGGRSLLTIETSSRLILFSTFLGIDSVVTGFDPNTKCDNLCSEQMRFS
ncbi:hypothetical protein F2Q69_00020055 [Brassica cretica]|uniref:Uncharacterized protein n=1 Tax=Brassica cretica TaxID=69181 RepID=A0A8S9QJF6_BRACR|nr:hypothetical protein F2Q69_00020055 [Brassica cretica]